jgi:hypothetical protein
VHSLVSYNFTRSRSRATAAATNGAVGARSEKRKPSEGIEDIFIVYFSYTFSSLLQWGCIEVIIIISCYDDFYLSALISTNYGNGAVDVFVAMKETLGRL